MEQSAAPTDLEGFLRDIFDAAIAAVDPRAILAPYLPQRPKGRVVVMGAGKATARMAQAVEATWGPCEGLIAVPHGASLPLQGIEVVETAHPVPDAASEATAVRLLELAQGLGADDLALFLISGGGSALLAAPAQGVSLADKQAVHRALLRSGASISQMNILRKQLSAIKGGHLAVAAHPAQVVTLLISDVPGDDPAIIASGPTVPDPSTIDEARAIVGRYALDLPPSVSARLASGQGTPSADHPVFGAAQTHMIATPMAALRAAQACAKALWPDLSVVILGDALEGEARDLGQATAGITQSILRHGAPFSAPVLLLSGGETTVTIGQTKPGRGGRNSEFLLSFATHAPEGVYALACDTDGIDGAGTNAGAIWSPRVARQGADLDKRAFLAAHDALQFFEMADGVVTTGPTHTNVNDFRAILIPADAAL